MNPNNVMDTTGWKEQLTWLNDTLNDNIYSNGRKFIIQAFRPPGLNYYEVIEQLWTNETMMAYLEIFH